MISSEQLRAARALLRWEQRDLAAASKVSLPSIKRLEGQPGPLAAQRRTAEAIQTAIEAAGVVFIAENGDGPGVRLRKVKPVDGPKPKGPATDAIAAMDQAIEAHKVGVKRRRTPLKTKGE